MPPVVEYSAYTLLAIFLGSAVGFAIFPLLLARLWYRKFAVAKPGARKNAPYECGLDSTGDPWMRYRADYYLYGIVFVVFDVEAVFLLPFAVAFTELPFGAWVAMLLFGLLLVEGLVWAWAKGVFHWR